MHQLYLHCPSKIDTDGEGKQMQHNNHPSINLNQSDFHEKPNNALQGFKNKLRLHNNNDNNIFFLKTNQYLCIRIFPMAMK